MENNKIKSSYLLGTIGILIIFIGISYATFNYSQSGSKKNIITTTSNLEFIYDESKGNSFTIKDAFPMEKAIGKSQREHYNFSVKANTTESQRIKYTVTLRCNDIDLTNYLVPYLETSKNDGINYANGNTIFKNLTDVDSKVVVPNGWVDKVIYEGDIPFDQLNYQNDFTFRMWVNGDLNFSAYEYVLKSVIGNSQLDVNTLARNNQIITSKEYQNLSESNKLLYDRIAYVDTIGEKVITESQSVDLLTDRFFASNQYYRFNNKTIKAYINVYANGVRIN